MHEESLISFLVGEIFILEDVTFSFSQNNFYM